MGLGGPFLSHLFWVAGAAPGSPDGNIGALPAPAHGLFTCVECFNVPASLTPECSVHIEVCALWPLARPL